MLVFLEEFIGGGYLSDIFDNLMNGLVYDNPLVIFFWICVLGFTASIICKAIFGG